MLRFLTKTTNCGFYFDDELWVLFWVSHENDEFCDLFLVSDENNEFTVLFFYVIWIGKVISRSFLLQNLVKKLSFCQNDNFFVLFYDRFWVAMLFSHAFFCRLMEKQPMISSSFLVIQLSSYIQFKCIEIIQK